MPAEWIQWINGSLGGAIDVGGMNKKNMCVCGSSHSARPIGPVRLENHEIGIDGLFRASRSRFRARAASSSHTRHMPLGGGERLRPIFGLTMIPNVRYSICICISSHNLRFCQRKIRFIPQPPPPPARGGFFLSRTLLHLTCMSFSFACAWERAHHTIWRFQERPKLSSSVVPEIFLYCS